MDQIDQTNQIDQMNQINRPDRPLMSGMSLNEQRTVAVEGYKVGQCGWLIWQSSI